ncbi:hypothetical protein MXB_3304 [Myxobolus squamalis]|nr:hypothetical protein MXB_3304 [Myxobolus squamalis]
MRNPVWKVLVYDRSGQDIISPLFTVSELRECGVTLHLLINCEREQIPESTAIYFLHPSESNLHRICMDMKSGLYSKYYLSFISPISRISLEYLANKTVESGCAYLIGKIYDEYLNYISLNEDLFVSRNFNSSEISFEQLNSKSATVEEMNFKISEIVDSLFCIFTTLSRAKNDKKFRSSSINKIF